MAKLYKALGLMSGTSMDGIDVALIETDGRSDVDRGPSASFAYPQEFRDRLAASLTVAAGLTDRRWRPAPLDALEAELTASHAEAVSGFLASHGIDPGEIDIVGFHGQTVLHRPDERLTVQLGNGQLLADLTGIDVVFDLRADDCAAGGQGAPLAPIYHAALASRLPALPAAFLNIGGVANVTYIGDGKTLIAFDTGPGNALIDDWTKAKTGSSRDEGGRLAASGSVDADALTALLTNGYFSARIPKSLDRNAFSPAPVARLSAADGAATLTAFTAEAVHRAEAYFSETPRYWIVCGGGRHNRTLMNAIAERVGGAVAPAEAIGIDGDSLEAEAWAYLAVRSLLRLPISFPMTTGAPQPMTGGLHCMARR